MHLFTCSPKNPNVGLTLFLHDRRRRRNRCCCHLFRCRLMLWPTCLFFRIYFPFYYDVLFFFLFSIFFCFVVVTFFVQSNALHCLCHECVCVSFCVSLLFLFSSSGAKEEAALNRLVLSVNCRHFMPVCIHASFHMRWLTTSQLFYIS